MENKRSIEYYESRMWDVKLEDITSDKENAENLRKLRDNDPHFTSIVLTGYAMDDDFLVSNDDDLGWLGYFIGRSSQLKELNIYTWLEEDVDDAKIDALAQGISLNRSISTLGIYGNLDFFLQRLGRFLRGLTHLHLSDSDIGLASARNLAVMLQGMFLENLRIERLCYDSDSDSFFDEGAVTADVMAALKTHTKLEHLDLWNCNLDRCSCMALGKLSSLKELYLFHSNVDDEGMKALVGAMENSNALEVLDISENTSITAHGLSSLASLLQSEKCCLRELTLRDIRIGDDGAAALAEALAGNKSLKCLNIFYEYPTSDMDRTGMTAAGWSSFSRLLCDTSSINNTYLSNHTLKRCDTTSDVRMREFGCYLSMNKNQQHVAMHKILKNYPDFDMKPLFQWQLKFLPLMVAWFGMARARCPHWIESIDSLQCRELSAIFQFVRGLPMMTVGSCRNQKIQDTDTDSKKRKFDRL